MPGKEPPAGMNSGVAVDLTGGAATGGETSNEMGDWTGSTINMGGGSSGSSKNILIVAVSFVVLTILGMLAWLMGRKK